MKKMVPSSASGTGISFVETDVVVPSSASGTGISFIETDVVVPSNASGTGISFIEIARQQATSPIHNPRPIPHSISSPNPLWH